MVVTIRNAVLAVAFFVLIPTIGMSLGIGEFEEFLTDILDRLNFFVPLKEIFIYFGIYVAIKILFIRFHVIKWIYNMFTR